MTTERDPQTRIVLSWLREDAHENAERLLLRALDEVDTTPQRRPWSARRFTDMNTYAKLAIAAAAVLVVAVAGFQLLPRTSGPGSQPTLAASPTASPTPTAAPSAMSVVPGPLEPGQYAWVWDGPDISFQLDEGWTGRTDSDFRLDADQPTAVEPPHGFRALPVASASRTSMPTPVAPRVPSSRSMERSRAWSTRLRLRSARMPRSPTRRSAAVPPSRSSSPRPPGWTWPTAGTAPMAHCGSGLIRGRRATSRCPRPSVGPRSRSRSTASLPSSTPVSRRRLQRATSPSSRPS